jgi:hypothetical protein
MNMMCLDHREHKGTSQNATGFRLTTRHEQVGRAVVGRGCRTSDRPLPDTGSTVRELPLKN